MKKNLSNLIFIISVVVLAGYGLWHYGLSGKSDGSHYPGSPVTGRKALFFGDHLLAPTHLQDPDYLVKQLGEKLQLEITREPNSFATSGEMEVQAPVALLKEKPNIVFISTGTAALKAREDLGTTVSHLKKISQEFQKNGVFVVHLGINPPGVGDNWSMGISHTCREIPILCIDDIFANHYTPEHSQDLAMPQEAYQLAVEKIVAAVSPYLKLSSVP